VAEQEPKVLLSIPSNDGKKACDTTYALIGDQLIITVSELSHGVRTEIASMAVAIGENYVKQD
jgi:hypothetical protein